MKRNQRVWVITLLLAALLWQASRFLPSMGEEPAFSVPVSAPLRVEVVGLGAEVDGIHQLSDARAFLAVIKMADAHLAQHYRETLLQVRDGERYRFTRKIGETGTLERDWIAAEKRMLLGIPLQLDRMTLEDWQALPGVGRKRAQAIDFERHKNGEFERLEDLLRISGIGKKQIKQWKKYFIPR